MSGLRRYLRARRGRASLVAAGAVGVFVLALLPLTSAHATEDITISGTATGRRFDGVGAISGGGGTSRLLPDYPAKQQSEILDYLFRPGFGANLQILKVEIGGDTNSTNGAEASHMRTPTDLNRNRGYEWWLMEQLEFRTFTLSNRCSEWCIGWCDGDVVSAVGAGAGVEEEGVVDALFGGSGGGAEGSG